MVYGTLKYNKLHDRFNIIDEDNPNNIIDLDTHTYLDIQQENEWEQMQIRRNDDNQWALFIVSTFKDNLVITNLEDLKVRISMPVVRETL